MAKTKTKRGALEGLEITSLNPKKPNLLKPEVKPEIKAKTKTVEADKSSTKAAKSPVSKAKPKKSEKADGKTSSKKNANKADLSHKKEPPIPTHQKTEKVAKNERERHSGAKSKPGPKSEKQEGAEYVKISVRILAEIKRKMKQTLALQAYGLHKTQDSFIETAVSRYIEHLEDSQDTE